MPEGLAAATTLRRERGSADDALLRFRDAALHLGLGGDELTSTLACLAPASRGDRPECTTALMSAADLLSSRSLEHGWPAKPVRRLVDSLAAALGSPAETVRAQLHAHAARNPDVVQLPPPLAVEAQLRMLRALAPLHELSFWTAEAVEGLTCLFSLGREEPTRRARLAARLVLEQHGAESTDAGLVHAVPVLVWQRPRAALIVRVTKDDRERALAAARQTAVALTLVLEREALLARNAARERALVESGERLLTRVGFDLHDGPIQDIAALAGDLRLLHHELQKVLPDADAPQMNGAIESLRCRLTGIDRALREVVHSLESPTVLRRAVDEVLRREVEVFRDQTDIDVDMTARGDFSNLTASQRIALVRIVQEALSNVREHSRATRVSATIGVRREHIYAEITDNGRGFNVERTLVRAAHKGRFGLVGMSERVRLLGGRFDITSCPGGPTTVSVLLPAWRPLQAQRSAAAAPTVAG